MAYIFRVSALIVVLLVSAMQTACESPNNQSRSNYINDTEIETPWGLIVAKTGGTINHPGFAISLNLSCVEKTFDFQNIDKIDWAIVKSSNLEDPLAKGESLVSWKKSENGRIQADFENLFPSPSHPGNAFGLSFPYGEYGIIVRLQGNEKIIATSKPIPISLKPRERY